MRESSDRRGRVSVGKAVQNLDIAAMIGDEGCISESGVDLAVKLTGQILEFRSHPSLPRELFSIFFQHFTAEKCFYLSALLFSLRSCFRRRAFFSWYYARRPEFTNRIY